MSTTATSRKPLKRRRKYLRLQADQRLKQNREDLPLLAHLQGLYLFLIEHWIDIDPGAQLDQAYPVAKKTKHSSSALRITSRRRWSDRILETER